MRRRDKQAPQSAEIDPASPRLDLTRGWLLRPRGDRPFTPPSAPYA